MRAFVTGGSGFLGRNLIRGLRARGDTVLACARSDGAALAVRQAGAEAVKGDLDDRSALREGMRGCDVVFHAAAYTHEWGPEEDFERVNVTGTRNVLDAAHEAGVRRVVHVSTEAVLVGGAKKLVDADESWPRPEPPAGLYPWSKALAEVIALEEERLEVVVARPRLIWGAGDTSLLPLFEIAARRIGFAWIGGGRHLTSTCHVRNAVHGLILCAEKGTPGEVYFLTDGEPVEMRGFLTQLLRTRGVIPGDAGIPFSLALALATVGEALWRHLPLPGAPPITRSAVYLIGEEVTVSDAKARRELGYRPVVSRGQGLAEMWLEGWKGR